MPCRATLSAVTCLVVLQRRRNATRLCDHIVSGQCLQRKLPEECIAELLANNSKMASADGSAAWSPARTVAVAVPVAVAGMWPHACVVYQQGVRTATRLHTLKKDGMPGSAFCFWGSPLTSAHSAGLQHVHHYPCGASHRTLLVSDSSLLCTSALAPPHSLGSQLHARTPTRPPFDILLVCPAGAIGLGAVAALMVWCKHRHRQQTAHEATAGKPSTSSNGQTSKLDVEAAGDQGPQPGGSMCRCVYQWIEWEACLVHGDASDNGSGVLLVNRAV